nr:hypothetical protein [Tanacetum cinerariifolium]
MDPAAISRFHPIWLFGVFVSTKMLLVQIARGISLCWWSHWIIPRSPSKEEDHGVTIEVYAYHLLIKFTCVSLKS